ncbi:osmotically inducible protein OsmC [Flavobacterium sp. ZB4P23]|uniref:OsmC family protein n=1 Tax=unclassified Flavobacterium TaxID=196869 RepID=UPI000F848E70|nr:MULTISPECIES: OsmC family protein [unclassified Flavobacterium]RTY73134.1 osmotically inducible protein OsmC [Flavobacterium sp. LS1R10]RTY84886.1 osmotically inducible protein OsmC [Flavobacterium sp. ZB4P23]RTZ06272.1 osmotically inducible protein OsmC [Flavobacterium sp. GSP6]
MQFKHVFKAKLDWLFSKKEAATYTKSHTITIDGKTVLNVSAAKAFKGDPALYNPEDLLLSSVVSCHMMSYLYVCKQNGIDVITYTDEAEATLEISDDGSGRFIVIKLNPKVRITNKEKVEEALSLHKKANKLCFIANSCNFPIVHFPTCEVAGIN